MTPSAYSTGSAEPPLAAPRARPSRPRAHNLVCNGADRDSDSDSESGESVSAGRRLMSQADEESDSESPDSESPPDSPDSRRLAGVAGVAGWPGAGPGAATRTPATEGDSPTAVPLTGTQAPLALDSDSKGQLPASADSADQADDSEGPFNMKFRSHFRTDRRRGVAASLPAVPVARRLGPPSGPSPTRSRPGRRRRHHDDGHWHWQPPGAAPRPLAAAHCHCHSATVPLTATECQCQCQYYTASSGSAVTVP